MADDEELKRMDVCDSIMKMYETEGTHESIIVADLRNCLLRVYLSLGFTPDQMETIFSFMSDIYRVGYEKMQKDSEKK